tara:strand:- start:485 stop:1000 length:516 start_codon:yes stop_codon:yes gene_type:complete
MAKSDSFFIRASAEFNGNNFVETTIDLGAYVDALGKSVLRIHNIAVQYGDPTDVLNPSAVNTVQSNLYQVTTQSQTAMVALDNRSVVASGALIVSCGDPAFGTEILDIDDTSDVGPQHWTQGYLVATENLFLGIDSTGATALGQDKLSIVMECTVETMDQNAAMALALSQQ